MGVSRDTFYRYKDAADDGGIEALFRKTGAFLTSKIVLSRSLNQRLFNTPLMILHMARCVSLMNCVNAEYLSLPAVFAVSGYETTRSPSPLMGEGWGEGE